MEYFSISEQYAKAPDNIKKASLNEKWNPNYRGTKYGDSLVLCKLIEKITTKKQLFMWRSSVHNHPWSKNK